MLRKWKDCLSGALTQVSPGDGGVYLCLATYEDKPLKAEVDVSVFSKFSTSYVRYYYIGPLIIFQCKVTETDNLFPAIGDYLIQIMREVGEGVGGGDNSFKVTSDIQQPSMACL